MPHLPERPRHPAAAGAPLAPGAEFDLIRRFLPRHAAERPDVRVGPGDDCAVIAGDGIALSSDLSVEGVHFRRDWLSMREIGGGGGGAGPHRHPPRGAGAPRRPAALPPPPP